MNTSNWLKIFGNNPNEVNLYTSSYNMTNKMIYKSGPNWATCRAATTGDGVGTISSIAGSLDASGDFHIFRMVLRFNLASFTGKTVSSVKLHLQQQDPQIYGFDTGIIAYKFDNSDGALVVGDFDNYSTQFNNISDCTFVSGQGGYMDIDLNASMVTATQLTINVEGMLSIMLRTRSDALDEEPTEVNFDNYAFIDYPECYLTLTFS